MKIVVTGEGPADIGELDYNTNNLLEGPVLILIRRLLSEREIDFIYWDRKAEDAKNGRKGFRVQGRKEKLSGYGKLAYHFKCRANDQSADAALFFSDADRDSGRDARKYNECKKRYSTLKNDIEKGFQAADTKAHSKTCKGVAIIAVKMIESWLLSDREAFDKGFGTVNRCEKFPNNPELEWGAKNDKNSNYPKNQLKRILSAYNQDSCREVFCKIAEKADITAICEKCPISFQPFCEDLKQLV